MSDGLRSELPILIVKLVIVIIFAAAVLAFFLWIGYRAGYDAAKHKYCTHGESSIAGEMKNGKFVLTHPAERTGC